MVNVTISVPEDLRAKMDQHPQINWSEVCRKAISECISLIERTYPTVEGELENLSFRLIRSCPVLIILIRFRNDTDFDIILDRIEYSVTFETTRGAASPGEGVQILKKKFRPHTDKVVQISLEMNPFEVLKYNQMVERTFTCSTAITAYFNNFPEPYVTALKRIVPIDDWHDFINNVKTLLKEMKDTLNRIQ